MNFFVVPAKFFASDCRVSPPMSFTAIFLLVVLFLASPVSVRFASAQQPAARTSAQIFDSANYGVRISTDARLLAVMCALDAAGLDVAPKDAAAAAFLSEVRAARAEVEVSLRDRLRRFYELNRLPASATPAEQAARYVSLAFALGDAPDFAVPARTDDLPNGVLEVLDFAVLVREFYKQANLAARLPAYTRAGQIAGDRLRPGVAEMLRTVLNRFRVRPVLVSVERIPVVAPTTKKDKKQSAAKFETRERERRFQITPDLLAAPGTINLRVVADDYFVVLPPGANPNSPELRRAYIQFLVEPLISRFSREISLRRTDLLQLLNPASATIGAASSSTTNSAPSTTPNAMTNTATANTPSVFAAVERSLVAAVDARVTQALAVAALDPKTYTKQSLLLAQRSITDARLAALADAYERGGVLAFYFSEQLDGVEASGFEATNLIPDMISTFDAARESRRLGEAAEARTRARETERRRAAEAAAATAARREEMETANPNRALLMRNLEAVEVLLKANNYPDAENRLRSLLAEHGGDARIFFAIGQAASLGAQDAIDEQVQLERLTRALSNYRLAVQAASLDTDKPLLSRAHTAIGRIHAFLEQPQEAAAAFETAVALGEIAGGSFKDAQTELAKLRGARE